MYVLSECHKSYATHKETNAVSINRRNFTRICDANYVKRGDSSRSKPPLDPTRVSGAEEICIISIETTTHRELSHLTHSSVERGKCYRIPYTNSRTETQNTNKSTTRKITNNKLSATNFRWSANTREGLEIRISK